MGYTPSNTMIFGAGFKPGGMGRMGLMEYNQQISTRYTGDICWWLCIRDSNKRLGDFAWKMQVTDHVMGRIHGENPWGESMGYTTGAPGAWGSVRTVVSHTFKDISRLTYTLFGSEWFKDSSRFFCNKSTAVVRLSGPKKFVEIWWKRCDPEKRSQPRGIVLEASYNPFVSLFQHSKFKGRRNLHNWNLGVYLTQNECCGKKNGKKLGETLWNCAVYDLRWLCPTLSWAAVVGGINSQERGPDTPKQRKRTVITVSAASCCITVSAASVKFAFARPKSDTCLWPMWGVW